MEKRVQQMINCYIAKSSVTGSVIGIQRQFGELILSCMSTDNNPSPNTVEI